MNMEDTIMRTEEFAKTLQKIRDDGDEYIAKMRKDTADFKERMQELETKRACSEEAFWQRRAYMTALRVHMKTLNGAESSRVYKFHCAASDAFKAWLVKEYGL
jgi:hypothetical protein